MGEVLCGAVTVRVLTALPVIPSYAGKCFNFRVFWGIDSIFNSYEGIFVFQQGSIYFKHLVLCVPVSEV